LATPGYRLGAPRILTYHKIGSHLELGITTVKRSAFATHLNLLVGLGLDFACATEVAGGRAGTGSLAITFDDGYDSVFEEAFPEMRERGITGTVFPVVDSVGGYNRWDVNLAQRRVRHLSWARIRELSASGFEIGSHTLSHRDLTRLDADALRHELRTSKKMIEDKVGVEVNAISYPFGRYSRRVIDEAIGAGYEFGFTSYPREPDEKMAKGRWGMYSIDTGRSLERKLGFRPGRRLERLKNTFVAKISLGTTLVKR
jgi:peptidoglycan/xylan/chitin deacetylase (PgdA/CDA1 family)